MGKEAWIRILLGRRLEKAGRLVREDIGKDAGGTEVVKPHRPNQEEEDRRRLKN